MSQYFEVLGLDAPPKDRREVKKAYSKQLKLTRPEEDPEGFMRLRDAHDQALNMLAWQAEETRRNQGETATVEASVTYEDMIEDVSEDYSGYAMGRTQSLDAPVADTDEESPTGYTIGAVPSLDAPIQEREAPPPPPLNQEIIDLLNDPNARNDRDQWNKLFREARELDIDDYVDFEALLLHRVLEVHGFFDQNNPHFETPEKMPKLVNAAITASLFKTMNWDKVGKFNYQTTYRIEWLERRMGLRGNRPIQHAAGPATPENVPNDLARWFWPALGAVFAFALLFDLITG